ncbi:MAG TPA: hypothetical protein VGH28_29960 [Polyangiaceae bacterium]|jgi:hypothetical protein
MERSGATTEIVRLAMLDTYGVEWPLATFARDVLQNFFDATPDFRDVVIDEDRAARVLEVRGPGEFDIELLSYVGATTKRDGRTAGGFGEGFKVCALLALRDFGVAMLAGSGDVEIEPFFDAVPLGRELCYRRRARAGRGSFVRLERVSDACFDAFSVAKRAFFYEGNPSLGDLVAAGNGAAVHASTLERTGELYYRGQKRGEVSFRSYPGKAPPLTFVCHATAEALEGDRDRRDLDPRALVRAVAERLEPEGIRRTIDLLVAHWSYGHETLAPLLEVAAARGLRFDFPPSWLARDRKRDGLAELAKRQGYELALSAFAGVGMRTPSDVFSFDLETRKPTEAEGARLAILAELYRTLLSSDEFPSASFEVFDSDRAAVEGQHLGDRVIVASKHLVPEAFDEATATVLHELAHETGGETASAFQNRLVRLLGAAMRDQRAILAARRAFVSAHPEKPLTALPTEPYAPEDAHDISSDDPDAVGCTIVVPPAFPPTGELVAAITSNAAALGIPVEVTAYTYGCGNHPGVPTFLVAGDDVVHTRARSAYRLRTYGKGSLRPSDEQIRRALLRARERANEPAPKKKPRRRPPSAAARARDEAQRALAIRDADVDDWFSRWAESAAPKNARGLARIWSKAIYFSGILVAKKVGKDRSLDANAVWQRVHALLAPMFELVRRLRRDDAAFEDGDDFETSAMEAAQSAALVRFATHGGRAALRAFRLVRELGAIVTRDDLADTLRDAVMVHAFTRAGLPVGYGEPRPLDLGALREAFDIGRREAKRYQAEADDEEAWVDGTELFERLETFRSRADKLKTRRTHQVKAAYDETLARTGDAIAAARAAVMAARPLVEG